MKFCYKYARPALTVDSVVFGVDDKVLKILLIQRGFEPFKDRWALPGGFVDVNETLEDAVVRELEEETGLSGIYLEQLRAFSKPDRDPREHVISFAFVALVKHMDYLPSAASDAKNAGWFSLDDVPPLAFDHADIIAAATAQLREKIRRQPIGFELLPTKFTLTQLQSLYEAILQRDLDKRNFRKKLLGFDVLVPLSEFNTEESRRPAQLYRFDRKKYRQLTQKGFVFEL